MSLVVQEHHRREREQTGSMRVAAVKARLMFLAPNVHAAAVRLNLDDMAWEARYLQISYYLVVQIRAGISQGS